MAELIRQYYALLSSPANLLTLPLGDLADSINIPLISVLLFGLIGAVAPCQLSTNVAALAFSLTTGCRLTKDVGADPGFRFGQGDGVFAHRRRHRVIGLADRSSEPHGDPRHYLHAARDGSPCSSSLAC